MAAIDKDIVLKAYRQEISRIARADISSKSYIRESIQASMRSPLKKSYTDHYDVFLSHSHNDEKIALGIKRILENKGKTVYIDYVNDAHTSDEKVSAATAKLLKDRMDNCSELIYVHTQNSTLSKWCPWELGYFDKKSGRISVAFVDDFTWTTLSQEYLQLYPAARL